MIYLSGSSNPDVVDAGKAEPRLGVLGQPGNNVHRDGGQLAHWGLDCGAYGKAARGITWTEEDTRTYIDYLVRVKSEVGTDGCAFAVTPDVLSFVNGAPIGDATATWKQSSQIFDRVRAVGFRPALVAQDGILQASPMASEWDEFDVLFLGGSDFFKLGPEGRLMTTMAKDRGKWVHMGRVNSRKRLVYAQSIGCDSADGTFIGFGPDKNLPKVLAWLTSTAAAA